MTQTQEDRSWWQTLWSRTKQRLTGQGRQPPAGTYDLYRQALSSTRARVIAEALIVVMIGFTVDDLRLLRFPGYILGLALAAVILSLGGLYHARGITQRLEGLEPDEQAGRLEAIRARGRLAAVVVVVAFLAWMAVFTLGVPPWTL